MYDLNFYYDVLKISRYILSIRRKPDKTKEDQRVNLIRGTAGENIFFRKDAIFFEYMAQWSKYFGYREFLFRKNKP